MRDINAPTTTTIIIYDVYTKMAHAVAWRRCLYVHGRPANQVAKKILAAASSVVKDRETSCRFRETCVYLPIVALGSFMLSTALKRG